MIIAVEDFPCARKPAYRLKIDFGSGVIKQSSAQITHYRHEELIGQQVVCIANISQHNIVGFQSEVLLIGAN